MTLTKDERVSGPRRPGSRCREERGYVLLTLMLMVSLMVIAAAAVAPSIADQIRRDRENELIRRGMQYRRAIRQFTKKTGRFPMKLEDLEDTNGVRYLRKRYKDPVTGKEFRMLHMADIPAATGTSANAWSLQADTSANKAADNSSSQAGQDPSRTSTEQDQSSSASDQRAAEGMAGDSGSSSANSGFSGGVIVGVASTSKKKTIREFNHRNHYNEWLFFYDPGFDRPFEVQGPTPLTHPAAVMQNTSNSSNSTPNSSTNTPNSSPPNVQPSTQQP
jgi:type II secretory pathway pseudopilin PulG